MEGTQSALIRCFCRTFAKSGEVYGWRFGIPQPSVTPPLPFSLLQFRFSLLMNPLPGNVFDTDPTDSVPSMGIFHVPCQTIGVALLAAPTPVQPAHDAGDRRSKLFSLMCDDLSLSMPCLYPVITEKQDEAIQSPTEYGG